MTMMQMLIVVAIVIVLLSLAYPIWSNIKGKKDSLVAMNKMKQLGSALTQYASTHDGMLPEEESASGKNDWRDTAEPEAEKAWYNALPRQLGMQGVGDYQKSGNVASFYSDSCLLFLPGADYPDKARMSHPMFAYAYNTKLQRKDPRSGTKQPVVAAKIKAQERTVAFLEQGLRGEKRALEFQKKYDGDDCKASAKQFVARSGGKGVIVFVDGHADPVAPRDILEHGEPGGKIKWSAEDTSQIIWTVDPKDDPNSN